MEKEAVISIFFQIAIVALNIVVAFIAMIIYIRHKRNQDIRQKKIMQNDFAEQLMQSQIEVQEQTFQQIGKELHDNVGQLLSSSRMLLGVTERNLQTPPDTLLTANATLGQAINELRSLSKSLDKEWLERFNFNENLHTEILRINSGNKVKARYIKNHEIPLRSEKQIILFRIVQEAIQNAIKHTNPKNIIISESIQNNKFFIHINDDGDGFEMNNNTNGMGLNNMKHRTALLGGEIMWDTKLGKGTCVIISLPLNEDGL